jgi:hypothetical protein
MDIEVTRERIAAIAGSPTATRGAR